MLQTGLCSSLRFLKKIEKPQVQQLPLNNMLTTSYQHDLRYVHPSKIKAGSGVWYSS